MYSRYGHYNELIEAGTAYLEGRISLGLFEETVNRIFSFVHEGIQEFRSIRLPEGASPEFQEDLREAEKGFSLFERGITQIKIFVKEGDEAVLRQGFSLVKSGCDTLNEVILRQEKKFGIQ